MKLDEIIGQKNIKKTIEIQLKACKEQKKPFPHTLMYSEPGLGKTSLALAIAEELSLPFQKINTASLKDPYSIIYAFIDMDEGEMKSQVIFLDEVHNLNKKVQEALYTAIEGNYISYEVQGTYGKEIKKQEIPPFTLLAATTEGLPTPFVNRFKHIFQLEAYSKHEIESILSNYNKDIDSSLISEYSRDNPRIAKRLVDWINDYQSLEDSPLTKDIVKKAMSYIGITRGGLTNDDIKYLESLSSMRKSGIKNLAVSTGLSETKISKEIEPFLIRKRYIYRTQQGRVINFDKIKEWKQ